jgi:beta-1,2-mannobiose phosphorylase / 1,2-beta-oligomannan phosphorylase
MKRFVLLCVIALAGCTPTYFAPEMVTFGPAEGIMEPLGGDTWEGLFRERGFVLREGGEYRMWYTAAACKTCPGKLGYATSADGMTFTRWADHPIFDDVWIEDVMVVPDGDKYYIFAEGQDDEMQLLVSTDRVSWTRIGRVDIRHVDGTPLSHGPYGTPTVIHENGVWYLLYERLDDGIWLATSTDLRTFTNVSDMPVIQIGPQLTDDVRISLNQVVKHEGRYYAYYNGQGRFAQWSIHVAVSDDLVRWEKFPNNPILPLENDEASSVIVDDGEGLRMYTMDRHVRVHLGH